VAQDRKESVSLTLTQTMQSLGIELDQEVSLSVDSEDKIRISGDFPEKSTLEEVLNENEELTTAFKQLSANQSMLDYISQLQHNAQKTTTNLADYFKADTDFNDLLSLADKYESLKSSDNRMGTLLGLSSSQNPYSYTYAPGDKAE
jgi:antitoxin component of MazEF toxin-antitoxin module